VYLADVVAPPQAVAAEGMVEHATEQRQFDIPPQIHDGIVRDRIRPGVEPFAEVGSHARCPRTVGRAGERHPGEQRGGVRS